MPPSIDEEIGTLETDEVKRLLGTLWKKDPRKYLLEKFRLTTWPGRPSEVLAMSVEQFKFESGLYACQRTIEREGIKRVCRQVVKEEELNTHPRLPVQILGVGDPWSHAGGEAKYRPIFLFGYVHGRHVKTRKISKLALNPVVQDEMHEYVEALKESRKAKYRKTGETLLWPWTRQNYWLYLQEACREAGIEKPYGPHHARHTVNHYLRLLDVKDDVRGRLLGHKREGSTKDVHYDFVSWQEVFERAYPGMTWGLPESM